MLRSAHDRLTRRPRLDAPRPPPGSTSAMGSRPSASKIIGKHRPVRAARDTLRAAGQQLAPTSRCASFVGRRVLGDAPARAAASTGRVRRTAGQCRRSAQRRSSRPAGRRTPAARNEMRSVCALPVALSGRSLSSPSRSCGSRACGMADDHQRAAVEAAAANVSSRSTSWSYSSFLRRCAEPNQRTSSISSLGSYADVRVSGGRGQLQ